MHLAMLRKMKSEFIRYQINQTSQHAVQHHARNITFRDLRFLIQATV
jgi:hypothetical protein